MEMTVVVSIDREIFTDATDEEVRNRVLETLRRVRVDTVKLDGVVEILAPKPVVRNRRDLHRRFAPVLPADQRREGFCGVCAEPADDEMGEFWIPAENDSVVAHGQCGLDAGLEIA